MTQSVRMPVPDLGERRIAGHRQGAARGDAFEMDVAFGSLFADAERSDGAAAKTTDAAPREADDTARRPAETAAAEPVPEPVRTSGLLASLWPMAETRGADRAAADEGGESAPVSAPPQGVVPVELAPEPEAAAPKADIEGGGRSVPTQSGPELHRTGGRATAEVAARAKPAEAPESPTLPAKDGGAVADAAPAPRPLADAVTADSIRPQDTAAPAAVDRRVGPSRLRDPEAPTAPDRHAAPSRAQRPGIDHEAIVRRAAVRPALAARVSDEAGPPAPRALFRIAEFPRPAAELPSPSVPIARMVIDSPVEVDAALAAPPPHDQIQMPESDGEERPLQVAERAPLRGEVMRSGVRTEAVSPDAAPVVIVKGTTDEASQPAVVAAPERVVVAGPAAAVRIVPVPGLLRTVILNDAPEGQAEAIPAPEPGQTMRAAVAADIVSVVNAGEAMPPRSVIEVGAEAMPSEPAIEVAAAAILPEPVIEIAPDRAARGPVLPRPEAVALKPEIAAMPAGAPRREVAEDAAPRAGAARPETGAIDRAGEALTTAGTPAPVSTGMVPAAADPAQRVIAAVVAAVADVRESAAPSQAAHEAKPTVQTMTLQISTADAAPIHVRLALTGDVLGVAIVTENSGIADAIEREGEQLAEALRSVGIELEQIVVDVRPTRHGAPDQAPGHVQGEIGGQGARGERSSQDAGSGRQSGADGYDRRGGEERQSENHGDPTRHRGSGGAGVLYV